MQALASFSKNARFRSCNWTPTHKKAKQGISKQRHALLNRRGYAEVFSFNQIPVPPPIDPKVKPKRTQFPSLL